MAKARWDRDRARRDLLAARDPDRSRPIACRIVVIWEEREVRETTIYADDSMAMAKRKKKEVFERHSPLP